MSKVSDSWWEQAITFVSLQSTPTFCLLIDPYLQQQNYKQMLKKFAQLFKGQIDYSLLYLLNKQA